jgi:hypothetical protein
MRSHPVADDAETDDIQILVGGITMEQTWWTAGPDGIELEDALVHEWRVTRLTGLGIPKPMAEVHADYVDWHQIARLVRRGCPWRLALRIVR